METLRRVLIVDDDTSIHEGFRICFRHDYALTCADSGEAALLEAERGVFPVVILDLEMPGLSGIETLRRLRKLDQFQSVIILTGHESSDTAIDALNLGAFRYIVKPFRLASLRDMLAEGFERYEQAIKTHVAAIDSPRVLESLGLSRREADVVYLLIQGDTNPEIAEKLQISPRTVEKHLQSIFTVLKTTHRSKIAGITRRLLVLSHFSNALTSMIAMGLGNWSVIY